MARSTTRTAPITAYRRNGWALVFYRPFRETFDAAVAEVERLKVANPEGWAAHPKAKLLKRIVELVFEQIPADPAHESFEQGNTLGKHARAWRRAKFLQRFRLFFRFNSSRKIIVFAWVNDENTLRARGAKTDPYTVFSGMLSAGAPPNDWDALLEACRSTAEDPVLAGKFGATETIAEQPDAMPGKIAGPKNPKRK